MKLNQNNDDIDETQILINALRIKQGALSFSFPSGARLMHGAADTIEALRARIKELEAKEIELREAVALPYFKDQTVVDWTRAKYPPMEDEGGALPIIEYLICNLLDSNGHAIAIEEMTQIEQIEPTQHRRGTFTARMNAARIFGVIDFNLRMELVATDGRRWLVAFTRCDHAWPHDENSQPAPLMTINLTGIPIREVKTIPAKIPK